MRVQVQDVAEALDAWSYETDFNDAAKLPPLTPRFVYLKQELFVRKF